MLTRSLFVTGALSATLAGCAARTSVVEERDPLEAERQNVATLTAKLNDPSADPAGIQALFESHAYTLLAHSKNKQDQKNLRSIQTLPETNPARVKKLESSFLDAVARDPYSTVEVRRIKSAFAKASTAAPARRAMWRLAAKTAYLYDI